MPLGATVFGMGFILGHKLSPDAHAGAGAGAGLRNFVVRDSVSKDSADADADSDAAQEMQRATKLRSDKVRAAMKHAWSSYEAYAFGFDELKPLSKRGQNVWGGMGTTLVDSLDTLWLMGMKEEFWRARDWVRDSLSFDGIGLVSFFETTIRSLGGLLAAYDLSGDKVFLEKALDLGTRLSAAFDSPSGIPFAQVSLKKRNVANGHSWASGNSILAEISTVQVEFAYLSHVTADASFAEKADAVVKILEGMESKHGLYPIFINPNTGKFGNDKITLGAMGEIEIK